VAQRKRYLAASALVVAAIAAGTVVNPMAALGVKYVDPDSCSAIASERSTGSGT
jgi:hypothetical protein